MSYYNHVYVMFNNTNLTSANFDSRFAGQMLPSGSIPIAVINCNTHKYFEIENTYESVAVLADFKKNNPEENIEGIEIIKS